MAGAIQAEDFDRRGIAIEQRQKSRAGLARKFGSGVSETLRRKSWPWNQIANEAAMSIASTYYVLQETAANTNPEATTHANLLTALSFTQSNDSRNSLRRKKNDHATRKRQQSHHFRASMRSRNNLWRVKTV